MKLYFLKKENRTSICWFLFVLLVLVSFYPYMFSDAHVPLLNAKNGFIFQLVYLVPIFLLLGPQIRRLPSLVILSITIQVLGMLISFLYHGGIGYILTWITLIIVLCLITLIEKKIGLELFFDYYNKWILLVAILGFVTFLLALLGVPPIYSFENLRDGNVIYSWGIGYTNSYIQGSINFIRYSGFFDEPGAMGYWGIFSLVINKLFIKNTNVEWLLIIILIFTFSFGYIVQILIYLFLFYVIGKQSKKKSILILLFFALIAVGIYNTKYTEYNFLYKTTYGRFENIERTFSKNFIINDHRFYLAEEAKSYFRDNPIMGVGAKKWSELPYMSDNPYETLAVGGIVGTFYIYIPFVLLLFLGLKYRDIDLIKIWIILLLGFLHRPFHDNLLSYFFIYSILYFSVKKKQLQYKIHG